MKKTKLSSSEIHDLINRYKSDLKKLEFQANEVNLTIYDLESLLKNVTSLEKAALSKTKKRKSKPVAAVSKTKKKRGRPAKKNVAKKSTASTRIAKKKVTAKPKAKRKNEVAKTKKIAVKTKKTKKSAAKKGGYKLTFWDEYVIESIKQAGKVRITQEILNYVADKIKATGGNADEKEIQNKVIRSLQKLANRRSDLKKVPYEGKGLAYALPEWMSDNGKLNKDYRR